MLLTVFSTPHFFIHLFNSQSSQIQTLVHNPSINNLLKTVKLQSNTCIRYYLTISLHCHSETGWHGYPTSVSN